MRRVPKCHLYTLHLPVRSIGSTRPITHMIHMTDIYMGGILSNEILQLQGLRRHPASPNPRTDLGQRETQSPVPTSQLQP